MSNKDNDYSVATVDLGGIAYILAIWLIFDIIYKVAAVAICIFYLIFAVF